MKRCAALAVLTALFVGTNIGHAQEAITIKMKETREGEGVVVKRTETTSSKVTVTDAVGQVVVDQKKIEKDIMEYTDTVLKREAGKQPTKVQRAYTKAQAFKEDNGVANKAVDLGLAGKTVLIEKTDGEYVFTFKGGDAVEGAAAAVLKKDFAKKSANNAELEKLVLPPGAVKPGATWKIDMPKIVKELSKDGVMDLNGAKSTGQGTLVKAYQKDGKLFAEMKFKMDIPLVSIGKGQAQMKFAAGAKIGLEMSLDTCVDGTSEAGTMKLKMVMTGTASIPAAEGAMAVLNVTADATQIQQDAVKK